MRTQKIYRAVVLACLGLALSGVNYCQRSFDFAAQTDLKTTRTPTPTPTPDEGVGPSETPTASPTGFGTSTPTPSPTSSSSSAILGDPFFSSLVEAGKTAPREEPASARASAKTGAQAKSPSNWLGRMYADEEVVGQSLDTDGDGFTDKLESDYGSDPSDPTSTPNLTPVTSLYSRISRQDSWQIDSDNDGVSDGAEMASGSDPRDPRSRPSYDGDGDGLSDDVEAKLGTNGQNKDTDGDGLRDDFELALGTNPFNNDTDGDGILDGKEVALGSDPAVPEYDPSQSFVKRLLP